MSVKQYMIVGLITFVVILIAALLFLRIPFAALHRAEQEIKENHQTTNEHSEQQAQFIQNISVQMEPTLNKLSASAKELQGGSSEAGRGCMDTGRGFETVYGSYPRAFLLENTLMEPYEVSSF